LEVVVAESNANVFALYLWQFDKLRQEPISEPKQ